MIAKVNSCSVTGIDGFVVEVEVDISGGLPMLNMVGLPEISVRESRDRVKTAIKNSGYAFPMDRVVVNLAPADVKKEGTGLDLPVAIGILAASGTVPPDRLKSFIFTGELSLDGEVKPVKGALPFALTAKEKGFEGIFVPAQNADEAALVEGLKIMPVQSLSQIVDYFSGFYDLNPHKRNFSPEKASGLDYDIDFSEVKGQFHVKRALEIAAAGNHHLLMNGPPGSGKSMMAKRLATILPKLTFSEAIEVTRIYSVLGLIEEKRPFSFVRPFRAPHHTISDAGLVGGGSKPVPGEISLAHNGVLFLDELPEFKKNVLEVLRQPMEDGKVSIARAGMKATYPSKFMLVAAMNPCLCGYLSDPMGKCSCTQPQIQKYRAKVSGPLLDRIDIRIEVSKVPFKDLGTEVREEPSAAIRGRVNEARAMQGARFVNTGIFSNAMMQARHLKQFCCLDSECSRLLEKAVDILGFSARACHSAIRVARTIADLNQAKDIQRPHMAEAIQLRGARIKGETG